MDSAAAVTYTYTLALSETARRYRREGRPWDSWLLSVNGTEVESFTGGIATAAGQASDLLAAHGITGGDWAPSGDETAWTLEGTAADPATFRVSAYAPDSASPMRGGVDDYIAELRAWGLDAAFDDARRLVRAGDALYGLAGQRISGDMSGGVHWTWWPELVAATGGTA